MTAPRFERDPAAPGPRIQGFAGRGFRVEGEVYDAVLLTPEKAAVWDAPAIGELTPDHVAGLLALDPVPEFLILGTGPTQAFAPSAFVKALEARGIGVEAMDSRAAARAWGMLRGEGRWIAAALMAL